jgi:hypothetical protein
MPVAHRCEDVQENDKNICEFHMTPLKTIKLLIHNKQVEILEIELMIKILSYTIINQLYI